jgi:hypothetical protein
VSRSGDASVESWELQVLPPPRVWHRMRCHFSHTAYARRRFVDAACIFENVPQLRIHSRLHHVRGSIQGPTSQGPIWGGLLCQPSPWTVGPIVAGMPNVGSKHHERSMMAARRVMSNDCERSKQGSCTPLEVVTGLVVIL